VTFVRLVGRLSNRISKENWRLQYMTGSEKVLRHRQRFRFVFYHKDPPDPLRRFHVMVHETCVLMSQLGHVQHWV
jgi:hypothetical protein